MKEMIFESLHRCLQSQPRDKLSMSGSPGAAFRFISFHLSPCLWKQKDLKSPIFGVQPTRKIHPNYAKKYWWKTCENTVKTNSLQFCFCCRIISVKLPANLRSAAVSFPWLLLNECCMPYLRGWRKPPQCENVKFLPLFFFLLPPHLPKLLVAPSTKRHTERLLICVFGWSRHAKRERRCDNRPHWLRICRCGTLLLLLWGNASVRAGRSSHPSCADF